MRNDTIFNEMTMMILKESKRSDCCDNYDDEFCWQDVEDTMKGLDTAQMSYTIDALPILKNEGGEECGEGCCESYMIEYDMLEKLIESYEDIHDEFEAHAAICEHYGMEPESLAVVFESDYVAKGLVKDAKENTKNYGLMRVYSNTIKNMINKGIRCWKKA